MKTNEIATLKPSELLSLLEHCLPKQLPVLVVGHPGSGKSSIARQATEKIGFRWLPSNPSIQESVDYKGYPNIGEDGIARFHPYGDLLEWFNTKEPTVVSLEDLGWTPPANQTPLCHAIYERNIDGKKISDHVSFMGTSNERGDKAAVSMIVEPLKSRFTTIVRIAISPKEWCKWWMGIGGDAVISTFIDLMPNYLSDFKATTDMTNSATPRTIENVGKLYSLGMPKDVAKKAYEGAAGPAFAQDFSAYINLIDQIPHPRKCIKDPTGCDLPDGVNPSYVFIGSLLNMMDDTNFESCLTIALRMHKEYQMVMVPAMAEKYYAKYGCHNGSRTLAQWNRENTII